MVKNYAGKVVRTPPYTTTSDNPKTVLNNNDDCYQVEDSIYTPGIPSTPSTSLDTLAQGVTVIIIRIKI